MATKKKNRVLRIVFSVLLLLMIIAGVFLTWLSFNYKRIILTRLPAMVAESSDSLYHMSIQDVNINIFTHKAAITGLKLWPDKNQAKALRMRHQRIPATLSTVTVPEAELYGISWISLLSSRSLDCDHVVVHQLQWLLEAHPHPEDSLFADKQKGKPSINCVRVAHGDVLQPAITYKYEGESVHFTAMLREGTVALNRFVYDMDKEKDTSNFLYSNNGLVRPDSIIFIKEGSRYTVKKPTLDFETGPRNIHLKSVKINRMVDVDEQSGKIKEFYNFSFPSVNIVGINWNKLIDDGVLYADDINAQQPLMDIHYISAYAGKHNKQGSYPNQQLHSVALKTNIRRLTMHDGVFRYTEPNDKSKQEGVIELEQLNCSISNITNLDSVIKRHNNCEVKIKAHYMHKSDVDATINLTLGTTNGHFTLDGYLMNLDAADITKQTQALALMEITSLHVSRVDVHQEGDETYVKGDLTMLYNNLKISLLKFNNDHRKNKRGPLSFIANTFFLYPDNPMKNKDVRKVSTTFARDSTKGFISMIWENILRGAQKTAVRSDALLNVTEGRETTKGEKPRKGFFKRLFGKKK